MSETPMGEIIKSVEPTQADLAREYVLAGWEEHREGYEWTLEDFTKEVNECSDEDIIILAEAIREKQRTKEPKRVQIHKPTNNWKQRLR